MFTGSRIHGFTDVFTCHQQLHMNTSAQIHGFTDVLGRKKLGFFSNLANVHRFTDSQIHGCPGQKKIRVFFQPSQCSQIHGFTDVFTCHQQLHINTSSHHSRIHGFTDVLGRKKIRVIFSNIANVHGFTDSRMSSLVISIFTSTPVHGFTGSRMSWAEKNKSFFPT